MISSAARFTSLQWTLLCVAPWLIGPAALWVHDFMLVGLKIPHPEPPHLSMGLKYLSLTVKLSALAILCRLAADRLKELSTLGATLTIGLLVLMLTETFRVIVIDSFLSQAGWSKGGFIYITLKAAPAILASLLYASAIVMASRALNETMRLVIATLLIALIGVLFIEPSLHTAFSVVALRYKYLDLPQAYFVPYPLKIYLVIYLTFVEPAIAALAMAALTWLALPGPRWIRVSIFAIVISALRGDLFGLLVDTARPRLPLVLAIESEGQFFLESLVLASLSAATWWWISERRGSPGRQF